MSYTIEYNRQFIRSANGITPVWLAGESNVWESTGGNSRRCRDWSVFQNLLGVTQEELLATVQSFLGYHSQHWIRNGKWVDDKALLSWVKLGCKRAASVEDILLENKDKVSGIRCSISIWEDNTHRRSHDRTIKTTEEFDAWLELAKVEIAAIRAKKQMAFPIVDFGVEDLRHPQTIERDSDFKVLFKHKCSYLMELSSSGNSSWSRDIRKACVFSYEEAISIKQEQKYGWIAESRLVSASRKDYSFNAVLRVRSGVYTGEYVLKRTRNRLHFTRIKEYAKHYATAGAAEKAREKIEAAYVNQGISLEVVIDEQGGIE